MLVQSEKNIQTPFAIWVQNVGCGFFDKSACKKTLTVNFGNRKFRFLQSQLNQFLNSKNLQKFSEFFQKIAFKMKEWKF